MRTREISLQAAGAATSNAITTTMAEEIENAFSAGDNRADSNGRSRKDKGSNGVPSTEDRGCSKKPLCDRRR